MLEGSPRGVTIQDDELQGFIAAMDMYGGGGGAKGASRDKAFYLKAYNGYSSERKFRAGNGETFVERVSVAIIGLIQPSKLREIFAKQNIGDGFLQRFISFQAEVAMPEDKTVSLPEISGRFADIIHRLATIEANAGTVITATPEAQQVMEALVDDLRAKGRLLDGSVSDDIVSHFGKLPGQAWRLVTLLHCFKVAEAQLMGEDRHPSAVKISVETAQAAAEIVQRFIIPGIFSFHDTLVQDTPQAEAVKAVASFILRRQDDLGGRITARDLRKLKAFNNLPNWAKTEVFLTFENGNWLYRDRSIDQAGRLPRYEINPNVWDHFSKKAEREREKVRQVREIMDQSFAARGAAKGSKAQ